MHSDVSRGFRTLKEHFRGVSGEFTRSFQMSQRGYQKGYRVFRVGIHKTNMSEPI